MLITSFENLSDEIIMTIMEYSDDDGNDLLLYTCLKVNGGRFLLIQYLIKIGCYQQKANFHGQTLNDILEMEKNQQLLKFLKTEQLIQMNPETNK
ncbi:hypothetical protein I4U23_027160 [Adineta vaga]|nr:hypothetical protein I4U23_027160 [Adineta vaga]